MVHSAHRGALLVVLGVVPLAAAYACSDFTSAAAPNDAGAESSVDAPTSEAGEDAPSPDAAMTSCSVQSIAAGLEHSCAVFGPTNQVACWGANITGESGADIASGKMRTTAGLVANLDHVRQLALGAYHSCALKDDGTVWCWGSNVVGELGAGAKGTVPTANPAQVGNLPDAVELAAGYQHTCALRTNGSVTCWGAGTHGQLGDGTATDQPAPVKAGVVKAVQIAAGAAHSCARIADGGIVCWGDNSFGELGIGSDDAGADANAPKYAHTTPRQINAPSALQLSAGHLGTCARFAESPVLRCWGNNLFGVLVPGSDATVIATPTGVPTSAFALDGGDIAIGYSDTCAVAADGRLFCWGIDNVGQIANATPSGPPSQVTAVSGVEHVATGYAHTCVIADASVSCFGWNEYGQLGQGSSDPPPPDGGAAQAHPTPARVHLPCP